MEGDDRTASPHRIYNSISIHSLRMEGDKALEAQKEELEISIHSLRMEGDLRHAQHIPIRGYISIHSLRMEGDLRQPKPSAGSNHFNPLPPHGGRPKKG